MQVKKYFEKKVSLLSTSDVRYDGELYTVDPSEQSIALKHVNCMGTEGRRTGDQAIAPSDCTYEFIIFRAVNIRELWLDEGNGNRRDLTDEILIPLRQGQTNNNYQKRDMYEQDVPKRKVGYQSHSSQQQGYDQYYSRGGGYDQYYSRGGGGGYAHGHQQGPPPPQQPYYDSYGHQQGPPPPQTYYDTPSQNNYYRGQQPYPQRQPRGTYGPPPVNVYQNQQRRQRPPQYYNQQQQQRPPQYYNQSYHRYPARPQYGYSQPRRYGGYNQQNRRYNNQQGGRNYSQQRNTRRQGGQSGGKTTENQAGTGAFLDTRRLRGTEIDIKNEQDFDFGAAKNEFDQKDNNQQTPIQPPVDTQQNGVNISEDKPVAENDNDNVEDNNNNVEDNNNPTDAPVVEEVADNTEETKTEELSKKYDKTKSFFDGLETETKKSKPKQDLQQQKDVDTKTFGSVAATYKSRHMTNRQNQGRYQNRNRNYNRQYQQQQGGQYQQQGRYQNQNRNYNNYYTQQRSYNQYNNRQQDQYQRQTQQNTYATSKWVRR